MGDNQLTKICEKIYEKHHRAIDILIENLPDKSSRLAEILQGWATEKTKNGIIEVVLDKCSKKYTRFKTKTMSKILPDASENTSYWHTKNYYFYEIVNNEGQEFYIQFVVNSTDIPSDLRSTCDRINAIKPSKQQKENWQFRIHFSNKPHCKNADELATDEIYDKLNKMLDEAMEFEQELAEAMQVNA